MFRIAAPELLADLEIGRLPEAAEIGCQLDRLETGRQEFHQDRPAPAVHPGRIRQAEAFLEPDPQDGGIGTLAVFHADAATGRNSDVGRSEAVDRLLLVIAQQAPEHGDKVDAPEFRDRKGGAHKRREP